MLELKIKDKRYNILYGQIFIPLKMMFSKSFQIEQIREIFDVSTCNYSVNDERND